MKKIILSAALLGSVYFVNAQVGIGTPTPATSAMLDITATDKGVLIPRVSLKGDTDKMSNTELETSLLVFNTATASSVGANVTPGFYYWNSIKWERIVNQTQLDQVISNQGDIAKIKALLDAAYGSNNLGATPSNGTHGGMVYTPAVLGDDPTTGAVETNFVITPAKFEYVRYVNTTPATDTTPAVDNYERVDATAGLISLIQGSETKTKIVTINNKQYYVSESYTGTADPTIGNETGVYKIDVVGGVVNNFNEILNQDFVTPITINGTTINDIKEYIQYLSQNSPLTGDTKIVIDATSEQASLQIWNGTVWNTVANTAFSTIVKANQSLTDIIKTAPSTNTINYVYTAEPLVNGTARTFTINLTADLIQQITNNTDIQTAIKNISKGNGGVFYNGTSSEIAVGDTTILAGSFYTIDASGNGVEIDLGETVVNEVFENFQTIVNKGPITVNGKQYTSIEKYIQKISNSYGNNVGYTTDEISVANNTVGSTSGALIPANSFYYVDEDGIKVKIVLPIDIEQFITALTSATTVQKQEIKNQLGDNYTTVVNTGDTWIDGGRIYKGIYTTNVLGGTANITGGTATTVGSITVDAPTGTTLGDVISIKILNKSTNSLITESVTDVKLENGKLYFRIGTGTMYNVLSVTDLEVKVLVEFSATTTTP